MEIIHVWALAGAFGLAALAATLKAVEYRHELKLANDVITVLRKEIDVLKQETNKRISNLEQLKSTEKVKLEERISNLEKQLHTFTSGEREEQQKHLIAQQQLVDRLNDEIIP